MRDWVREGLARVGERYPAARVARSQARWSQLWQGTVPDGTYPFMYAPVTFNYYDAVHTHEGRLQAMLDEFLARPNFDDDFVPTLFTGCRNATIPGLFGAREVVLDGDHSSERLLTSVEDVDTLPAPAIAPESLAQFWLDMERYLLEETEGALPVHVTDMQGPADVCGKLLGYDELFIGAISEPDAYHRLMTKVTDAFLLFWAAQRDLLGAAFVPTHLWGWSWVPVDNGATMSVDSLVMLSPDFYDEFYAPYITRIADAFGGVAVHSCGNFAQVVPNLCRTPGITAINTSQMTLPQLLEAGLDASMLVIMFTSSADAGELFSLIRAHNLRVEVTVAPDWPKDANGTAKPVADWTRAEYDAALSDHQRLLAAAAGSA
jgi:hypothetical protein